MTDRPATSIAGESPSLRPGEGLHRRLTQRQLTMMAIAGAIGVYAETYLNRWAGFSVRATYGAAQIIAIGAEVTAAGIYISFWFPNVPRWIWVASFSAALVALNAMNVSRLGEFEYWFAM